MDTEFPMAVFPGASDHGRDLLIIDSFKFRKAYFRKDGTLRWRCCVKSCKAWTLTSGEDHRVVRLPSPGGHSHPPDIRKTRRQIIRSASQPSCITARDRVTKELADLCSLREAVCQYTNGVRREETENEENATVHFINGETNSQNCYEPSMGDFLCEESVIPQTNKRGVKQRNVRPLKAESVSWNEHHLDGSLQNNTFPMEEEFGDLRNSDSQDEETTLVITCTVRLKMLWYSLQYSGGFHSDGDFLQCLMALEKQRQGILINQQVPAIDDPNTSEIKIECMEELEPDMEMQPMVSAEESSPDNRIASADCVDNVKPILVGGQNLSCRRRKKRIPRSSPLKPSSIITPLKNAQPINQLDEPEPPKRHESSEAINPLQADSEQCTNVENNIKDKT